MLFPEAAIFLLAKVKSPKSVAFAVFAMVINSIELISVSGEELGKPPAFTDVLLAPEPPCLQ